MASTLSESLLIERMNNAKGRPEYQEAFQKLDDLVYELERRVFIVDIYNRIDALFVKLDDSPVFVDNDVLRDLAENILQNIADMIMKEPLKWEK